ncbi:hypothetical protein, partial [Microcystis sp. M31BS1]|uniref:hypothetical protein n=1 Tax=Microcystis sp. M31BS1 TaxID=2771186 RepID=UPI0025874E9C
MTEKDFYDYFAEETISIGFVSTHKPEEPDYFQLNLLADIYLDNWLFGLCYAMDGSYKGWNPYIERHLAIFVNCFFLERTNQLSLLPDKD